MTTETFDNLAARIRAAQPRLGDTRLVCVDGPAGSGKTTFASRLAGALRADSVVVHMDDLYEGWTDPLAGALARLRAGVLEPLAEGRPGAFFAYDWDTGAFRAEQSPVPLTPVLIVEGCGSSPRALDRWTTVRIWVEAPSAVRLARGLTRDGADLQPQWRRWLATEAAEFAREDTRARANLRVDGAATASDDGFVLLD